MGIPVNQLSLVAVSAVDAPLIQNTNQELSILGPSGVCTFAAGLLSEGATIQTVIHGIVSNRANAPGKITLRAKLGGVVVWNSGALQLPSSAHTDIAFWLNVMLTFRAGGVAAKVRGAGILQAALGSQTDYPLPSGAPADSATFDADGQKLDLDITAQFDTADPSNRFQLEGYQVLA